MRLFRRARKCILLADDEAVLVGMFKAIFNDRGYRVFSCHDGSRAVQTYRKHRDTIVLSILDLDMPGKNGMECITVIRGLDPRARILVISGFSDFRPEVDEVRKMGLSFMRKPFHVDDLVFEVERLISGRPIAPQAQAFKPMV